MRRILWFRRDLRVTDNPLLSQGGEVLPIFIFDPEILARLRRDDRRVTYIFDAVVRLKSELQALGMDLILFHGRPCEVFDFILERRGFDEVCASGDYGSYERERDRDVSHRLPFRFLEDTYIFSPDEVLKDDGTPYLVFTPYYNKAKSLFRPEHLREYRPVTQKLAAWEGDFIHTLTSGGVENRPIDLASLGFKRASLSANQRRTPNEKLAFFAPKLPDYPRHRDIPALEGVSGLSADLRFGTVSVRAVLRWLAEQKKRGVETEPFFRQLVFREFYASLLYRFPYLGERNFRYRFTGIGDDARFEAFRNARTGVPIVDAGIRQLLESGEMHNRIRMVCAGFLTKNLLLPWQWGERFFADNLLDYDAASNILSWQWSAGTGIDPQPYFRIFNPYTQTARFDPGGIYIKQYLSELRDVPAKILADERSLLQFNIPGYPPPIVSHKESSARALQHFKSAL
ncbi:MAG: cryptochrome/photolyase family protein [Campylobacterota bacterium]